MSAKEAEARIKINKLLEEAGWRFFEENGKSANIQTEPNVNSGHWYLSPMVSQVILWTARRTARGFHSKVVMFTV
ncbi:MAG: hypothetical protein ACOX0L_06145 [Natronincolaceae bacterium]|mgnify:CR=1 FL=1|jgi:hypothetical protein|nr:hypothetical protein [Bacillota bacterium]